MGCGGSKEEKQSTAVGSTPANDKPQPIKKVRTNFSDIHYDEPASGRRETVYAPSEVPESRRPTEIAEEGAPSSSSPPPAPIVGGDGMLSPGSPASPAAERRRSWYDRFQSKSVSDEDMKQAIGMDKAALNEWAKNRSGVGAKQDSRYAGNALLHAGGDGG